MIVQWNSSIGAKDKNANGILVGNFGNVKVSHTGMVGVSVYDGPYLVLDGLAIHAESGKDDVSSNKALRANAGNSIILTHRVRGDPVATVIVMMMMMMTILA